MWDHNYIYFIENLLINWYLFDSKSVPFTGFSVWMACTILASIHSIHSQHSDIYSLGICENSTMEFIWQKLCHQIRKFLTISMFIFMCVCLLNRYEKPIKGYHNKSTSVLRQIWNFSLQVQENQINSMTKLVLSDKIFQSN